MMTRLPSEYQEVEYLQGTGTQYIRTGYFATGNTSVKIKYKIDELEGFGIFGSRDTTSPTNAFLMWGATAGYWRAQYGNQNFQSTIARDTEWHTYEQDKNKAYLDGELFNEFTQQTFQNTYEQLLFGIGGSATTLGGLYISKTKIAYAEYRENGILICEFIPCYRKSDKVAGMYDLINHEFLENAGTGAFEVGADVLYYDDFQEIEYLQSTGRQYIHTNFIPTKTANWEVKLSSTATGTNWVMGANFWVGVHYSGGTKVGIVNSSSSAAQRYASYNRDNTPITLKLQGTSVYADGNLLGTINRIAGTVPFTIFGYRNNATSSGLFFIGKIYYVKLYDGETIKHHFKPVKRKDTGELGLYDTITGEFLTNKGTDSFIGGADVKPIRTRMTYYQGNDVPSAYHKLDYLQTSSGSKAYMITDYKQTNATTLKIVAEGAGWIMGGRTVSPVTDGLGVLTTPQAIFAMYGSENKNVARDFTTGIHTYEIGRGGLWVDGVKLIDYTPQVFKSQSLMWLWNIDDKGVPNNSYFVGKIYSAQILENGQVVRDYVPVYRGTDGVNGMYDRCFGGFIANAGGGVFNRGNEVSTNKNVLRFVYTADSILPAGYKQLESLNLNMSTSMNTAMSYQASTIEQVIKFNTKNKRQLIGFSSSNTTYWGVTADNQYEVGPNFIIPATEKDPFEWHKVAFHTDGKSGAGRVISILVDDESTVSRTGSGSITGLHAYDITSSGYINDAEIKYIKKTLDENNEVVSWLYPALRESDNAVGWYDIITNQFRVIGQAIAGTQTYYKQLRFIGV